MVSVRNCFDMCWKLLRHVLETALTCVRNCFDMCLKLLRHVFETASTCV
jgi:hypothetical protein